MNSSELLAFAKKEFLSTFHSEPIAAAFAPGRVNVIGEHTDYNNGFVMPIALELGTMAVGKLRKEFIGPNNVDDELVVSLATSVNSAVTSSESMSVTLKYKHQPLSPGIWTPSITRLDSPHWANYILGVVACFSNDLLSKCSQNTRILLEIMVSSSIPLGAGLSSSAALEISCYYLMHTLLHGDNSPFVKNCALACQKVEHEFARVPCGIMDQMISAGGKADSAMLIDCRDITYTYVNLPKPSEAVFVVADTGVRHQLASSEYATRRKQCESACKKLNVSSLRDIEQWDPRKLENKDDIDLRRARHVITENGRCLKASSLMNSDLGTEVLTQLGKLMVESHVSLRDDYEVSCNELNKLVEAAIATEGVYGSRMTGGGFGGSTVTLVQTKSKDNLVLALKNVGALNTLVVSAADGARIMFNNGFEASQTA